ncbi:NAP-domain-containing protein [Rickenella mellea]|uniref:NAP-domain-containing protein n=1 Tax=Rickenella mellea TaxID=50990 RepID=A0A4Y7PKR0_9AGAM|nr:NAP-domain-containing protein [Rickenella mellea]
MNINQPGKTAPTPQNTPLTNAPISSGLSRPTVPDITEDAEAEAEDGDSDAGGPVEAKGLQNVLESMMQSKLMSLVGKSSGYIESLPVDVKRNVEALKGVQVRQTELQNQYKRECLELEKKYLELQKPLYERRHAIITGAAAPTTEEIAAGEAESTKDDPEYTPLPKEAEATPAAKPAGIPDFWLTALQNHVGISELITERDAGALKHLLDIRLSYLPPSSTVPPSSDKDADKDKEQLGPGFVLSFVFAKNEYFENDVLQKTYIYQPEVGYAGDFLYEKAVGTEIRWLEGMDLTKEYEVKKQRNKNTNRTRLVRKAQPTDSFFNFFAPPVMPSDDAIEKGEVDADDLEELEARLEIDYQIGEDIKERIIPRAVDYFTGKALEYEDIDDDDDDDDEEEDDDEDDDDDDDEDSDSSEEPPSPTRRRGPPPRGRKSGGGAGAGASGAGGAGAQNVNAEECKNQ